MNHCVKIQGGLGNQLFQWAYGLSLSKKYNVKYNVSNYQKDNGSSIIPNRELCIEKLLKRPLLKCFVNEGVVHEGYWQSETFFLDLREEILNSINFQVKKSLDFKGSCSLHVRRGDYLKLQHIYEVLDENHYFKCLDKINPKGNIFIFSDEIAWCKKIFKGNQFVFMEDNKPEEDLIYISLCKDNIISNSTFSWWGAWLNKNQNKKIIAPKKWFKNQPCHNLIPKNWQRV